MGQPKLDRLKSQLLTTGLQQKDNPLFQVLDQLISYIRQLQTAFTSDIAGIPSGIGTSGVAAVGYWTPLIISNNSNSLLGTFIEDSNLVGELVLTDTGAPIMVWNPT